MPGLARWLTPGRCSCKVHTIYQCYSFILFFFCFFFLLLLLSSSPSPSWLFFFLGYTASFGRKGSLSFLAGELDCLFSQGVDCLFGNIFYRVVVILRACVGVAVAEFLWSVTDLTKDESPHTGYTFTPWMVSFTPPGIQHQVGGTSILRLFRRTVGSHKIDFRYPDWQV